MTIQKFYVFVNWWQISMDSYSFMLDLIYLVEQIVFVQNGQDDKSSFDFSFQGHL